MRAIVALIDLFTMLVIVSVVTSWVQLSENNPIRRILRIAVDPVLEPVRRLMPSFGGMDFSPVLVLLVLRWIKHALLLQG